MKVFGMWHGGYSHSEPEMPKDVEEFDSIDSAKRTFEMRNGDHYWGGDESATMTVYFYDPRGEDVRDPYPDRIISFGPRGGVKVERC